MPSKINDGLTNSQRWYKRHGLEYYKNYRLLHRKESRKAVSKYKSLHSEKWKEIKKKADRKAHLKNRYGLTLEDFERLVFTQFGRCAICREKFSSKICIDHDHRTGKVRGLLCDSCNRFIGAAKDDPEILNAAIKYLKGEVIISLHQ